MESFLVILFTVIGLIFYAFGWTFVAIWSYGVAIVFLFYVAAKHTEVEDDNGS